MMTEAQIKYELDYWLHIDRAKNDARQRKILELWGFAGAELVAEIGTGPWGGCLPFVEAVLKVGFDPLYPEYEKAGLMSKNADWGRFDMALEEIPSPGQLDAVLCMNTLDHGDTEFSAIEKIAAMLKPGGRFYLHVNLRSAEQLNEGHDHALREEDLILAIERNGLRYVSYQLYDHDPVEYAPYSTVVGVWERSK